MLITLDPTGIRPVELHSLAPRLRSMNGATVGVLHNNKVNAKQLIEEMANVLQERFEIRQVVGPTLTAHGMLASKEQLDEFAEKCDLVLTGLGD